MAEPSPLPLRLWRSNTSPESEGDDGMAGLIESDIERVEYNSFDEEDASVTMTMSDASVLECPICLSPLTIPVYQCVNGHTTCTNCFPKLRDKWPSCSEKLGKIRCRAIERIIESAEIPCIYESYGCSYKLGYMNKHLHEDRCSQAPFGCPLEYCDFRGLLRKIPFHIQQKHGDNVTEFNFNSSFSISLNRLLKNYCCVLLEERDRTLFVVTCPNDCVKIWCFRSYPSRYAYALMAKRGRNSQWFQSSTEKAVGMIHDPPSVNFLLIPDYLFREDCTIELDVCIWNKKDASDADICKFVCDSLKTGSN